MKNILEWTSKVFHRPCWVIALAVAVVVALGFTIPRVDFDNSAKAMLPKDNRDVDIND